MDGMRPLRYRILHWAIILFFVQGMAYAGWQVFQVRLPGQGFGPLGAQAQDVPLELMVTRRLYAMEFWLIVAGFALYLGVTVPGLRGIPRREK